MLGMWGKILSSKVLSFEQMMDRIDQLSTLGVLYPLAIDKVDTRFTEKFFDTFNQKWIESMNKQNLNFNNRIQVASGAALKMLHPELSDEDFFELSKVCSFIWIMFYKVTTEKYEEFLAKRKK